MVQLKRGKGMCDTSLFHPASPSKITIHVNMQIITTDSICDIIVLAMNMRGA